LPKGKPPTKPESEKPNVTGRVGQMFSKHLICVKYFFFCYIAFLPSLLNREEKSCSPHCNRFWE